MNPHKTISMFGVQLRNFIGNCLICLLIAFNTYPAMNNIIADALGTPSNIIPICTLNGISYLSLDDSDESGDSLDSSKPCFFCQANTTPILPPCNHANLGPVNIDGQRLAIAQYQELYHKSTTPRPHPRGPPLFSSL